LWRKNECTQFINAFDVKFPLFYFYTRTVVTRHRMKTNKTLKTKNMNTDLTKKLWLNLGAGKG